MASGYSLLIYKKNGDFFEKWVEHCRVNLYNLANDFILLDDEGNSFEATSQDAKELLTKNGMLNFRIKNNFQNFITCTLKIIDNYFVVEQYSMEELIENEEYNSLKRILHNRYMSMLDKGISIGILYDIEGYTEDYFSFGRI